MDRPTIADLARAAGVSISTVDRVINGRDPVRKPTGEKVLAAATEIGFHLTGAIRQRLGPDRPKKTFGFLLQQKSRPLYHMLGDALSNATKASDLVSATPRVVYLDDLEPSAVAEQLERLGKAVDAVAVVAANHPRITAAIDTLNDTGTPVFALISELTAQGPVGYVGLDNWKVGRTAAWTIANICKKPGKVGIFVGSHRYRCQDQNEMGFRSFFREHAKKFTILEALTSLEESRYAAEMTRDLLARTPDLVGLYVAGGGIRGVMTALQESNSSKRIVTVGHELIAQTRAGLIDGVLKLAISHPVNSLTTTLIDAMARAVLETSKSPLPSVLLPFDLHTAENL